MTFLADSDFKRIISDGPQSPIRGADLAGSLDGIQSQIQPCSIDLRIDEILLPCEGEDVTEASVRRTRLYGLKVGQSVRVVTQERFALPDDIGGLVFAPARLTRRGIVVPDIGHIDPGFDGPLRFTLINMGRDEHSLKAGDMVATALLFRLQAPVGRSLRDRKDGPQPYAEGITDTSHLSSDFLNIEKRIRTGAASEVRRLMGKSGWKYAFFSWCLPIVVGVLSGWLAFHLAVESRLRTVEAETQAMQMVTNCDQRLAVVEAQLGQIREGLAQGKGVLPPK